MVPSFWTLWQLDELFAKLSSEVGSCLYMFFFVFFAWCFFTMHGNSKLLLFHSCSKCPSSGMSILPADYHLYVLASSPCVLLEAQ